jgi:hypothetical protein
MICLLCHISSGAQNYVPVQSLSVNPFASMMMPPYQDYQKSLQLNQSLSASHYAAVSAGYVFYPEANAFYISAPIGWQLNKQLNKNLYAFGGVYVAPTLTSFNTAFMNSPYNKSFPGSMYPNNYFSINPGIYMGLMYVNDAGTFSISGSIHAQGGSYPVYPAAPTRARK